ncbi:MAG: MFS transporter [Casimicrobiaceae bacterium]
MNIYTVVALSVCTQIATKGSKMLVALSALELHASPFAIGLLIAMYALFPMQLALYAGRVCDRRGVRLPMGLGSVGVAVGLVVPVAFPELWGLYACAIALGSASIFYQVSAQYTVGAVSDGPARTRNFAVYSLGGSISGFIGPLLVGFVLEGAGRTTTYAALAAVAIIPAIVLTLLRHRPLPRQRRAEPDDEQGSMRLTRNPGLRHAFITSAVILTGLDLFSFYMPIYGRALGLSPSSIGIVLSTQAAAAFVVRLFLPRLVHRLGDAAVLRTMLALAGAAYLLFPFVHEMATLAAVAFVMGLALGCGHPLSMQLVQRHAPTGRVGEAIGLRLTFNRVTQIAVPLVFGSLSGFGVFAVFWANSALLFAGSLVRSKVQ